MKHIRKRRNFFLCPFPISLTSLTREVTNRLQQRTLSPNFFSNLRRGCGDSTITPADCQFLSLAITLCWGKVGIDKAASAQYNKGKRALMI